MMCYKDMTFCSFDTCKNFGINCHRSLTKEVIENAIKWYDSWAIDKENGPPICVYIDKPICYEKKEIIIK
jgi:hypothetical protein